jgi:hypothetical protein
LVWLSVWATEVRHEDDGLGSVLNGMLDCRERADNALVVCDVLVGVKGNVEVDLSIAVIRFALGLLSRSLVLDVLGSRRACP